MNVTTRWYISGSSGSQIAASIEAGIRDGHLPPATRLPTVRALAERLGVSPTTVAAVYRDLGHRGLVTAAGRLGTVVRARPPLATTWKPVLAPGVRDLASGNPDPALLPDLAPALRDLDTGETLYGQVANDAELIEMGRARLIADGIPAAHLTLAGGAMDGVERVLQAHLRPGDRIAVEDPGYPGILDLLGALGLTPRPVALDSGGMLPDALAQVLDSGVEAVVLTPRAQNPYGAALDPARAGELRALLSRHPAVLVIEDDHAGDISGSPAQTLCSPERERWAVLRSFSKSLGPDLRCALLTGDATTVARVEGRRLLGTGWVSHILQRLVVRLWKDPATNDLLRHAEQIYAARRQEMLAALTAQGIAAHGRSGINVWIPVADESSTVAGLLDAGWGVVAGERFRTRSGRGIRVSTGRLRAGEAERFAADLATLLGGAPTRLT